MERVAFLVDRTGERIDCMLNPETFEVRRLAGVRPHTTAAGHLVGAGLRDDPLLFTGGGRTELVLDLVFDVDLVESRVPPEDVRQLTGRLWSLAENTTSDRGGARPPLVRLVWGKTWNVPAVIVAVAERFDAFSATGVPRRSWLSLKLVRAADEPPRRTDETAADGDGLDPTGRRPDSPGSVTDAGRPVAAVQAVGDGSGAVGFRGVRFDLLATEALGSPHRWRELADHNGVADPLAVAPGAVLAVPPTRGSGS
jgi:hypothetical protein